MDICIFCQRAATLTAEHLWSKWMNQLLVPSLYQFKQEGQKGKVIRTWKGNKFNLTAKLVCPKCNNEWMSDLENKEAKPVMQAMIAYGNSTTLSPRGLAAIAAFTFKTAIVADHMQKWKEPFFSSSVRHRFATSLEIPNSIQIWLASFKGKFLQNGILASCYYEPEIGVLRGSELYVLTFGLGYFVVQALARKWKKSVNRPSRVPTFRQNKGWDGCARYFWPSDDASIIWPSNFYLSDNTIKAFCDRWQYLIIPPNNSHVSPKSVLG